MSLETVLERIAVGLEQLVGFAQTAITESKTDSAAAHSAPAISNALPPGNKPATAPGKVASRPATVVTPAAAAASPTPASAAPGGATPATVTFDVMKKALVEVKTIFGPEASRAIMQAVGVVAVTEIKPEDFARVLSLTVAKMATPHP